MVHTHPYSGTRGKRRLAGVGNGTCTGTYSDQHRLLVVNKGRGASAGAGHGTYTGTYSNHHRPLVGAPAQHFVVHIRSIFLYIRTISEGRGAHTCAPGPATGHAPAHIPLIICQ